MTVFSVSSGSPKGLSSLIGVYPLIAQNSISACGKSLERWMAKAWEFSSCFQ